MTYNEGGRRGGVYCAMVVQKYCNRVGFAGEGEGGGEQYKDGLPQ